MKNLTFILPTLMAASTSVGAEDRGSEHRVKHQYELYAQISSYSYLERDLMSKKSEMPFLGLGYARYFQIFNNKMTATIEGQYGTTNYHSSDGMTGPDRTLILETQLERTWLVGKYGFSTGLAYRFLYDFWGNQTTSSGLPTYDRQSEYFFSSIGATLELNNGQSAAVRYKHLIQGTQTSYLEDIDGIGQLTKMQPSGFGLAMEYALDPNLTVFLDYWSISASNLDTQGLGFFEPPNETLQVGFRHHF
ncbi:hypothetical protein N9E38_02175 [Yoonia sp.]|nr:hypothetical protein [Yoonia sp.]